MYNIYIIRNTPMTAKQGSLEDNSLDKAAKEGIYTTANSFELAAAICVSWTEHNMKRI